MKAAVHLLNLVCFMIRPFANGPENHTFNRGVGESLIEFVNDSKKRPAGMPIQLGPDCGGFGLRPDILAFGEWYL